MDSAILAVVAGFVVALLYPFLSKANAPIVARLAALGYWWGGAFVVLVIVAIAALCPSHLTAAVRGLRRFPAHCGLIAKTLLGFIVALLVLQWVLKSDDPRLFLHGLCVAALVAIGLTVAHRVALLLAKGGRGTAPARSDADDALPDGEPALTQWLRDDQPICDQGANLLPEHRDVADRIVSRLLLQSDAPQGILPSVAIIGPYGSGKTSICNLVRDLYHRRRPVGDRLPKVRFCRYEAWQYLTAGAAVRGLVETVAEEIFAVADVPQLWRLPDQYVSAIKEGGGAWARVAASLFGSRGGPGSILSGIGEALERLGLRLVVFVDDFDRIEQIASDARLAVAQALNQLQSVPNIQYIVAVGPTRAQAHDEMLDLMKLTRYQELVPRLDPKCIIEAIRSLRNEALEDTSIYCPWAEAQDDDKDPLSWHESYGLISPRGQSILSPLIELLDTPRALKSALRETRTAWLSGLEGEINWYELLLASALRVAEPAIFEWIERDRDLFTEGPNMIERMDRNTDRQRERAGQLKDRVYSMSSGTGAKRQEAALSAVKRLFPAFRSCVDSTSGSVEAVPWRQGIGCIPLSGRSYLERFVSGRLDDGELHDQPTLQFIRQLMQGEVDKPEVESMYLDSLAKLTGDLNKLVQFSGLLSLEKALQVCDVILAWVAIPEHARQWPKPPHEYYGAMTGDVYHIIGRSDDREQRHMRVQDEVFETREQTIYNWLYAKVDQYAATAWHMLEALLGIVTHQESGPWSVRKDVGEGLWQQLAEQLRKVYFVGDRPLIDAVGEDRFAIYRFIVTLQQHKDYDSVRPAFTTKFIEQADADKSHRLKGSVILSLTPAQYPVTDGECPVEAYTFTVDKQRNEQLFDMSVVVPAIQSWADLTLPDPVAQRAFEVLKEAYGIVK